MYIANTTEQNPNRFKTVTKPCGIALTPNPKLIKPNADQHKVMLKTHKSERAQVKHLCIMRTQHNKILINPRQLKYRLTRHNSQALHLLVVFCERSQRGCEALRIKYLFLKTLQLHSSIFYFFNCFMFLCVYLFFLINSQSHARF